MTSLSTTSAQMADSHGRLTEPTSNPAWTSGVKTYNRLNLRETPSVTKAPMFRHLPTRTTMMQNGLSPPEVFQAAQILMSIYHADFASKTSREVRKCYEIRQDAPEPHSAPECSPPNNPEANNDCGIWHDKPAISPVKRLFHDSDEDGSFSPPREATETADQLMTPTKRRTIADEACSKRIIDDQCYFNNSLLETVQRSFAKQRSRPSSKEKGRDSGEFDIPSSPVTSPQSVGRDDEYTFADGDRSSPLLHQTFAASISATASDSAWFPTYSAPYVHQNVALSKYVSGR